MDLDKEEMTAADRREFREWIYSKTQVDQQLWLQLKEQFQMDKAEEEEAEYREFLEWKANRDESKKREQQRQTFGSNAKTVEYEPLLSDCNRIAGTGGLGVGEGLGADESNCIGAVSQIDLGIPSSSTVNMFEQYVDIPSSDLERLDSLEQIGCGTFGDVFLYVGDASSSERQVAIKRCKIQLRFQKKETSAIRAEVELHKALSHPNIIGYFGSYQALNHICIIMEFAEKGSLWNHLHELHGAKKKLSNQDILSFTKQILEGLHYLHNLSKPIIHRDLKSPNVLLCQNDVVKIADFGESKQLYTNATNSQFTNWKVGSDYWRAPEMIAHDLDPNDKTNSKLGRAIDIWAVGIIMLEMIHTSKPPAMFKLTALQYHVKLCVNKELPEIPEHLPDDIKRVLRSCQEKYC